MLADFQRPRQNLADERVLFRAKISLRSARPFSIFADRGHVENRRAVALHEILQQARDFRLRRGVFHVLNRTRQLQNLLLAQKLLRQIGIEELHFLRERTRQIRLLHALGVDQFILAELQHLAVIKPNRQRADEQHRSQHEPKNANPAGPHLFHGLFPLQVHTLPTILRWRRAAWACLRRLRCGSANGTKVLPVQSCLIRVFADDP